MNEMKYIISMKVGPFAEKISSERLHGLDM